MADRRRDGLNNQKRTTCFAVVPLVEADILSAGSIYINFPKEVVILSGRINVKTAGSVGSTLDIVANGVVLCNEVDIDDTGVKVGTVNEDAAYLPSGGTLEVKAGATPPNGGGFVGHAIIEYVELFTTTGAYTN